MERPCVRHREGKKHSFKQLVSRSMFLNFLTFDVVLFLFDYIHLVCDETDISHNDCAWAILQWALKGRLYHRKDERYNAKYLKSSDTEKKLS